VALTSDLQATSYTATWKRNGRRATLHVHQDGAGAAGLVAAADQITEQLVAKEPWMRTTEPEQQASELDGRPALLRRWGSKRGQARLWCARRGEVVYVLALTEAGLFAGDEFEGVHEAFRFD